MMPVLVGNMFLICQVTLILSFGWQMHSAMGVDTCPGDCLDCICGTLSNGGKKFCGDEWKAGDSICGPGCITNGKKHCGCGPYLINKRYFRKCKKLTSLPIKRYTSCVRDEACARQCVCAFVKSRACGGIEMNCNNFAHVHFHKGIKSKGSCKLGKSELFRNNVNQCLQSAQETPCTPLIPEPYSNKNPGDQWGNNNDAQQTAPPKRMGYNKPYPTHHFSVNQAKVNMVPIIQFPYVAVMSTAGATYDAYPLDRWSDPSRQMLQLQATPNFWSWEKFPDVGTNMEQPVMGPDGNPFAIFTGRSGVQIGMIGVSKEPVWEDYSDLYANWKVSELNGNGTIDIPLVRGSALITHIYTNADPLVKPFCLTSINGATVSKYNCPIEQSFVDVGSGYLNGSSCTGSTLHIILRMTKPRDLNQIQWAANTQGNWPTSHVMNNCGPECVSSDGGKRVDITISGASGTMLFAINNIGYYTLPKGNWIANPETVTCTGGGLRKKRSFQAANIIESSIPLINERQKRDTGIAASPFCTNTPILEACDGLYCKYTFIEPTITGTYNVKVIIVLRDVFNPGVANIAVAFHQLPFILEWVNCNPSYCHLDATKKIFTYCREVNNPGMYGLAVDFKYVRIIPSASPWSNPFLIQVGGTPTPIGSGLKFNLELDEPGTKLSNQTRKFVLYFSQNVSAFYDADGLTFKTQTGQIYSGTVKLGYLGKGPRGDTSMDNFLDPYKYTYSLNPTINYCMSGDSATVEFDWNKQGTGHLLMNVLPHQNDMLTPLMDSPSGYKTHVGDKWSLVYSLPPATLMPAQSAVTAIKNNPTQNQDIMDSLDYDSTTGLVIVQTCDTLGSYFAGKDIAMATRAASISRAFNTTHFNTFDPAIKNCLEKWLRINDVLIDTKKFHYETVWGGIMNKENTFGFATYSDHHFHIGYWLYAIAYYAKYYPAWTHTNIDLILYLARDVGNPSVKDPYYGAVRHKDMYLGQSWASGVHIGTRDQESSSEAINCYHALAALGDALIQINSSFSGMRDFGRIWLAMEIKSVKQYYHVRDQNINQFPPLIQHFGGIGMFSEHSVFRHTLFFGCDIPDVYPSRHGCLKGIQVLPVTSVSNYFMDQTWAKHVNLTCQWAIDPSTLPEAGMIQPDLLVPTRFGWGVFCLLASSAVSPAVTQQAIDYVHNKGPNDAFVGGTGRASTMLFLYGRT